MEKKKVFLKKSLAISLAFLTMILIAMVFVYSCNGDKNKKSSEANEQLNENSGASSQGFAGSIQYSVLLLKKDSLLKFFSFNQTHKLLIGFCDSTNTTVKTITAVSYSAKNNNDTTYGPVYMFPILPDTWDGQGAQILGNNELSEKDIKKVLGNVNQINSSTVKDLYFYPIKKANNHIYYIVSTILAKFQKKGSMITITYPTDPNAVGTNPSPPAPPCSPCD